MALPTSFLDKLQEIKISPGERVFCVKVSEQKMSFFEHGELRQSWSISTARNGVGQAEHSYQTPLGLHRIRVKLGKDAPDGAIFRSRVFNGELWNPDVAIDPTAAPRDLITTRILWLEGLEKGLNSGLNDVGVLVDSYERYIYIHGTNHENDIGKAASRGCIRMLNHDVKELFDIAREGDLIWIEE